MVEKGLLCWIHCLICLLSCTTTAQHAMPVPQFKGMSTSSTTDAPVRACYLGLSSTLGEMATRSLGTRGPCTHVILEQGEGPDSLIPDGILKLLKEAKSNHPALKYLVTTTPQSLLKQLKFTWQAGGSPRAQWLRDVMTNLTRLGMDGINMQIDRNPSERQMKQTIMVLKHLSKSLLPGNSLAASLSLDTIQTPEGLEFLKRLSSFAQMLIFENSAAQLAGLKDTPIGNASLSKTISLIQQGISNKPIVIKVPLYEGLRLQSMYKNFQQTMDDMKDRMKKTRRSVSRFSFTKAKNAMWKSFVAKGCELTKSGGVIRDNLKKVLKEFPDLGIALWSLNYDDLTHICSDTNLYFTNLMLKELDGDKASSKVKAPEPKTQKIFEMTPTGPQLLIMQDPSADMARMRSLRTKEGRAAMRPVLNDKSSNVGTVEHSHPHQHDQAHQHNHPHEPNQPHEHNHPHTHPHPHPKGTRHSKMPFKSSEKFIKSSRKAHGTPLVGAKELPLTDPSPRQTTPRKQRKRQPTRNSRNSRQPQKQLHMILLARNENLKNDPRAKAKAADMKVVYASVLAGNHSLPQTVASSPRHVPHGAAVTDQNVQLISIWTSGVEQDQEHKKHGANHRTRRDTVKVGSVCDFDRPIPDPEDCRHYLLCNRGTTQRYYCGQNAVFDPTIKSCSSPNSVEKCKGLQTIWRMREEANFKCESEGYFQHPTNCQLFFRCTRYSTHLFRCPDGLGFDASTATCDIQASIQTCKGTGNTDQSSNSEDTTQTKKMSNWRGQMQIREQKVPAFSAHQQNQAPGRDSNTRDPEYNGNPPVYRDRGRPFFKEGPANGEIWKGNIGGMEIHIAENEEELLQGPTKDPKQAYDAPELRRIQIWPSAIPTVPAMRSPTPTQHSPSHVPDFDDDALAHYMDPDVTKLENYRNPDYEEDMKLHQYTNPDFSDGTQRQNYINPDPRKYIDENQHAKSAPVDPYNNMDIVHAPTNDDKKSQEQKYGSWDARDTSWEAQGSYSPIDPASNSFHFTDPSRQGSRPGPGQFSPQWPEHIEGGWLSETGGISIAIARDFHCPSDGYFRDPTSCKRFYHCSHGLPYHVQCTGGLVFNPRNRICDWQKSMPECMRYDDEGGAGAGGGVSRADAKEGWISQDTRRNNTYNQKGCVPGSVRTHRSSCAIFHVCSAAAVEYQFRCPDHLMFDERSRRCVRADLVPNCRPRQDDAERQGDDSANQILDDPTDSAMQDFRCPTTYGFYRDSENCSRFYECAFWIPFQMSCPIGALFSMEHRRCEHADRVVECLPGGAAWKVAVEIYNAKQQALKQAGISTSSPMANGPNNMLMFKCTQNGRFSDPTDCQIFHECDDAGNHAEYRCPNTMAFNAELGLCDLRHNVLSCTQQLMQQQQQPPQQQPPQQPQQQQIQQRYQRESVVLSHNNQAPRSRYDIQKSGPENPQQPQPTQQSVNYEHAWSVNGGSSSASMEQMNTNGERPLISPRVPAHMAGKIQLKQTGLPCQGDSVFHNPSDCRQFFWCYKSKLVMNTCPEPLVFNTDSYQCDLLEFVPRCNSSPLPTPSSQQPSSLNNPYTAPTLPASPPRPQPSSNMRRQEPKVYQELDLEPEPWISAGKRGGGGAGDQSMDAYYSLEDGESPIGGKGELYSNPDQQDKGSSQKEFQCPGDGFHRDEYNCSHFYYCKDGWRYKYACAEGRAFDEARSFCNWRAYVPGCS